MFTYTHSLFTRRTLLSMKSPLLESSRYRVLSSSSRVMSKTDWSASQYLKFEDERTMPARDLLARVPLQAPRRVVDLGCGPGNSTAVLAHRYPNAHLVGMDSSPDMIQKAKATLPAYEFSVEDLRSYSPPPSVDLFFSNAVLQWLKKEERIAVVKDLMETQPSGGVFAFQVPDNLMEPSHVLMREVAGSGPWASTLSDVGRDTFQSPHEIYNELKDLSSEVKIFRTEYYHSLEDHSAIVEWVKGTGLRPYVDPLSPQEQEAFLREYLKRLESAYPKLVDGRVLLPYPRLFVIAVRK
ncbi:S-adenosyl-L-methionine-dependent methyltransferase [Aspergillus bertholletiae]|uniref:S-adenosyl-L-methionine-dependent methyltransferase n=1 Tax=Aspergillus bertholletiae TaxID=1226010 RepID=A0A5N7AQP8_9EURO|nr:S-adenosyl-L-methionine-dependent methyltransferase [Aspergillus bertholletiae]